MENPIKMNDLGVAWFLETHMDGLWKKCIVFKYSLNNTNKCSDHVWKIDLLVWG